MVSKVKKRFIAGAVCPRCSEMDKLMMYKEDEKNFRECISCGFKDEMRFQQQTRELETRVNLSQEIKKSETQVLTLDPTGSKRKQ